MANTVFTDYQLPVVDASWLNPVNQFVYAGIAPDSTEVIAAAPAAVQPFYLSNGTAQFYTVAATTNWIVNLSYSPTASLNSQLSVGSSVEITMLVTNSVSAYYSTGFEIDGIAVTPKWDGGAAPSSGDINSVDIYTYTVLKTANAAYSVFASAFQYQ